MKLLKTILATAAITGFASSAMAQDSGVYATIGADYLSAEGFDLGTLTGRLGYNITEYFGVEGQASRNLFGDSGVSITDSFAGFGTARYPVNQQFDVFARAGYHFTDAGESDDGFALGAGGQYNFTNVDGIRLDYTYLDASDGVSIDVVSLSYVRKF